MSGLSETKRRAMAMLLGQAPEPVLQAIEERFQGSGGGLAADVVALARNERLNRAVLHHAFGPVLAFSAARADGVRAPFFAKAAFRRLWAGVRVRRPDLAETLMATVDREVDVIAPPGLIEGICLTAASIARGADPASLGLANRDEADDLAAYLDMSPFADAAIRRLPDWLGRMDGEQLAGLKLCFKDADAVREDGRARLLEMLLAQMPRAADILKLLSALTDHAGAEFIDRTEMAHFASRLIEHAETLGAGIRMDAPGLTLAAAESATADLVVVSDILTEFDLHFAGLHGGAWTPRLLAVRRRLTSEMEAAFRAMPKMIDRALPLGSIKLAGRMSRLAPDHSADPDSEIVHRARAALHILAGTRSASANLGSEGARRAAADGMAERIDSYAEESLQMLQQGVVEDTDRALALIEVAAEFLSLTRNEQAGALVRRRAAVAINRGEDQASEAA